MPPDILPFDLPFACKSVQETRTRIRCQIKLIRQMQHDGSETALAMRLLAAMRRTLDASRSHRDSIKEILYWTSTLPDRL